MCLYFNEVLGFLWLTLLVWPDYQQLSNDRLENGEPDGEDISRPEPRI